MNEYEKYVFEGYKNSVDEEELHIREESKRLYRVLSATGILSIEQALRVNSDVPAKVRQATIHELRTKNLLFFSPNLDYVYADYRNVPDTSIIRANEIIVREAENVDPSYIYAGEKPSLYGFIKNNINYEILCENLESQWDKTIKETNAKFYKTVEPEYAKDVVYILVLGNKEDIEIMPKMVFPHIFAIVKTFDGVKRLPVPDVHYIR